jgi:hypothetical protein
MSSVVQRSSGKLSGKALSQSHVSMLVENAGRQEVFLASLKTSFF